jgi:hypothetical protein
MKVLLFLVVSHLASHSISSNENKKLKAIEDVIVFESIMEFNQPTTPALISTKKVEDSIVRPLFRHPFFFRASEKFIVDENTFKTIIEVVNTSIILSDNCEKIDFGTIKITLLNSSGTTIKYTCGAHCTIQLFRDILISINNTNHASLQNYFSDVIKKFRR